MTEISQLYVLNLDRVTWENTSCTCTFGLKEYKCCHSIILACRLKLANFHDVVLDRDLESKQKRGRSERMPINCLDKPEKTKSITKATPSEFAILGSRAPKMSSKSNNQSVGGSITAPFIDLDDSDSCSNVQPSKNAEASLHSIKRNYTKKTYAATNRPLTRSSYSKIPTCSGIFLIFV
jgi:hypothetical protein